MAVGQLKRVGPNLYRSVNGTYYSLLKRGGKQFRKSLKTSDPALAKRRLSELQAKLSRVSTSDGDSKMLFEDLTKRWIEVKRTELKASSLRRRETALKGLMPYFAGVAVRSIGQSHIEAWKTKRGVNLSARSWNIEAETLHQVFHYAQNDLRILIENPGASLKRKKQPKSAITIPSKEQFRALIQALRTGHRATGDAADLVEFLAYSGCRLGEALGVYWRDVNFDIGTVLITGGGTGTKNHEERVIPLFEPLRRLLIDLKVHNAPAPDTHVFRIASAHLQLVRACERLGLPRFGHHTMRHFFCSNAIESGCDFKVIAGWLGHKDGGVLVAQTYGHLRSEHSSAMAKRITFDAIR